MREKPPVERDAYSIDDLVRARTFGGRSRIYDLLKQGILDSYKSGKLRRITAASVKRHQAELLDAARQDSGLGKPPTSLIKKKPSTAATDEQPEAKPRPKPAAAASSAISMRGAKAQAGDKRVGADFNDLVERK
jgi:hypothetical protein